MTLAELYFRNGNIDLLDDVVLVIGDQLLSGKLYQFDKYFNFTVRYVSGKEGKLYYLMEDGPNFKGFRHFCRIYSLKYFLYGSVDVYYNGRFFKCLTIDEILNCEFYDNEKWSFKGNSVFFDDNLL